MKKSKEVAYQPQTEMEYWQVIDFLGYDSSIMIHHYNRGHTDWTPEQIKKHLEKNSKEQLRFLKEILT